MTDSAPETEIAAARAYEQLHVPALFRQWAGPMLEAARIGPGDRVLDVACGTGVLARAAAERVGSAGQVTGLDPQPGMLAVAAELAPTVDWRAGVAEDLPFPDARFDAVVSQFGLMFFTDRHEALRQMKRVLAPRGRLAVAVWDTLDRSAAYPLEVDLLERVAGIAAADALRAPFVLGNPSDLDELFRDAGFATVAIATRTGTARFPSVRAMVEADLRGWLPVMGVVLAEELIDRILTEAESVLAEYVTTDGEVVFDSPAHIVTAVNG